MESLKKRSDVAEFGRDLGGEACRQFLMLIL